MYTQQKIDIKTWEKAEYNAKVIARANNIRENLIEYYKLNIGSRINDVNDDSMLISDLIENGYELKDNREFFQSFFNYVHTHGNNIYLKPTSEITISEELIMDEYNRIKSKSSDYIHIDSYNINVIYDKKGIQKDELNTIVITTSINPINKRKYILWTFCKQFYEMSDVEKTFTTNAVKILKQYKFATFTKKIVLKHFLNDEYTKRKFYFKLVKDISHTKQTLEKILNKINKLRDINGFHLIITELNNGFE